MKAVFTLVLILFFALAAQGQQTPFETKVEARAMELLTVEQILLRQEIREMKMARLYRRPHARVKKALSFTTRRDRPQVA